MASKIKTNHRVRRSYSKIKEVAEIPNLISIQKRSYDRFLQKDVDPEKREEFGLQKIFSLEEDAPEGLKFGIPDLSDGKGGTIDYKQRQAVFNVSQGSSKDKLYVVLVAVAGSDLPDVPRYMLPDPVPAACCAFPGGGPTGFINDLYNIDPSETASFFIPFPYPGIEHQILYEFTLKKKKKNKKKNNKKSKKKK